MNGKEGSGNSGDHLDEVKENKVFYEYNLRHLREIPV